MLRRLLLLLAVCAVLCVSFASASPAHWHSGALKGTCEICLVAHLPAVQPPAAAEVDAPGLLHRHIFAEKFNRPAEFLFLARSPRAPPVW